MSKPSENSQAMPAHMQNNSNLRYISELKSITSGTKAKDLTEEQKQAFVAMMRMVHDPKEVSWTKRKEKLNRQYLARMEAISKQREEERLKKMQRKLKCRESLKVKIQKMRAERRFPLLPKKQRGEQARRHGFIPRTQRKINLEDYAKI